MDDLLIDMGDGDEGEQGEHGFSTMPNGDMVVDLGGNPFGGQEPPEDLPFDANLAEYLSDGELTKIANDICTGIEQDQTSRSEWLDNHAEGIKLLGMVLEKAGTAGDAGSTGLEGQHKTYHPLLLEASLLFVANAMSALLPAAGPAKIRDDHTAKPEQPQMPMPPMPPMMGHNGGPALDDGAMNMPQPSMNGGQGFARGGGIPADDRAASPFDENEAWLEEQGAVRRPFSYPVPMGQQPQGEWGTPDWDAQEYLRRYPHGRFGPDDPDNYNPSENPDIYENENGTIPIRNGGSIGMAQGGTPPAQPFASQGMGDLGGQNGQPVNINVSGQQPNQQGQQAPQQAQPQMPPGPTEPDRDMLAEAFEKDFNHYLTTTAKEYYPDTRRMLFSVGFGGLGIKKVYNDPIRRRPVAESVPIENFIVSNAFSDLGSMPRITHKIAMRPAVLRRMQLLKAYRDVELGDPIGNETTNAVKEIQSDVMGVNVPQQDSDPDNRDYDICEVYCELELDQFAPSQFKGQGLPLPYKVTLEKGTQTILEIRRNWKEDDEQCLAKEYFVEYVYVQGFGFYPIGLVHILGNTCKTLTALEREMVDAGMFANFPGFLYAKGAGRQLTNQFRVPPGGGIGLDVGLKSIQEAAMALPYKDVTPGAFQLFQALQEMGQRLGGAANINVGESRADAPVGTTLALIEQATKPLGSVLKGLHSSQSKELQLLKERFKEDPGALRRFNKKPAMDWQDDQVMQALEDYDLVPVSDPNNPTHMHRIAKANTIYQMGIQDPTAFDHHKMYKKIFSMAELGSPDDLFAPPQAQGGAQDPFAEAAMADVKVKALGQMQKAQSDTQKLTAELQDKREARESAERIEASKLKQSTLNLASTMAIHSSEIEAKAAERAFKLAGEQHRSNTDINKHAINVAADLHGAHQQRRHDAIQQQFDRSHANNKSAQDRAVKFAQAEHDRATKIELERVRAANKPPNGRTMT